MNICTTELKLGHYVVVIQNPMIDKVRFIQAFVMCIIILVFLGQDNYQASKLNVNGALSDLVLNTSFGNIYSVFNDSELS